MLNLWISLLKSHVRTQISGVAGVKIFVSCGSGGWEPPETEHIFNYGDSNFNLLQCTRFDTLAMMLYLQKKLFRYTFWF